MLFYENKETGLLMEFATINYVYKNPNQRPKLGLNTSDETLILTDQSFDNVCQSFNQQGLKMIQLSHTVLVNPFNVASIAPTYHRIKETSQALITFYGRGNNCLYSSTVQDNLKQANAILKKAKGWDNKPRV